MFSYYFQRFLQLGFAGSVSRIYWNCRSLFFLSIDWVRYFLFSPLHKKPSREVLEKFKARLSRFHEYVLEKKKEASSFGTVAAIFEFGKGYDPSKVEILGKSYSWPELNFDFWNSDWGIENPGRWYFDKVPFFQTVKMSQSSSDDLSSRGKEIKFCWEVGRMHFLSRHSLETGFLSENILESFWTHCPYLGGVQWKSPMEVGIRAVNIINALGFASNDFGDDFLEKVCGSLQQHSEFINHYWETSATPNNHYLANLVSYVYIRAFFDDKKDLEKLVEYIWNQFLKQISADGTFYEGSVGYHRLNLEMMIRFCLLDRFLQINKTDINFVMEKVAQLFLETYRGENFVKIGDDDSGKFIFGLRPNFSGLINSSFLSVKDFPGFGLTVVRSADFCLTLRNYSVETEKQPLGHFHHDNLSLTLSWNGKEIFTDSGSGSYTSNVKLRNDLRSHQGHSTFFISADPAGEIFHTNVSVQSAEKTSFSTESSDFVQTVELFAKVRELAFGKEFIKSRAVKIEFDLKEQKPLNVSIDDSVSCDEGLGVDVCWNWVLGPGFSVDQAEGVFVGEGVKIEADLPLQKDSAIVARGYLNLAGASRLSGKLAVSGSVESRTVIKF